MYPRFYYPNLPTNKGVLNLSAPIRHHALNVLRLKKNDWIALFDGQGQEVTAQILNLTKQEIQVEISQPATVNRETPIHVTLVQALPSGEKMDWIIEKGTELGIASIQPIQATRSIVKLNTERSAKKQTRWQEIAIAACAQCGRNTVPTVLPVASFDRWITEQTQSAPAENLRLLMDLAPEIPRLSQFDFGNKLNKITVMVGPEGAFTAAEISAAKNIGFAPINLGARILRTETAGLAFMAAINVLQGDF